MATLFFDSKDIITQCGPAIIQGAQSIYDEWQQDEDGQDEELGGGGICHLIADHICNVLGRHEVFCVTSCASDEQHVSVIAACADGVCNIDIPYRIYEFGAMFTWTKKPDVIFDVKDIERFIIDPSIEAMPNFMESPEEWSEEVMKAAEYFVETENNLDLPEHEDIVPILNGIRENEALSPRSKEDRTVMALVVQDVVEGGSKYTIMGNEEATWLQNENFAINLSEPVSVHLLSAWPEQGAVIEPSLEARQHAKEIHERFVHSQEFDISESERMNGGCFALAEYLHKKTGFPLLGACDDEGNVHHAFLQLPDGRYLDGRGIVEAEGVLTYKEDQCAGGHIMTLEVDDISWHVETSGYAPDDFNGFENTIPELQEILIERKPSINYDM